MTVFVLTQEWQYEGEAVLGVYASLEDAQATARAYDTGSDFLQVYAIAVGSAADLGRAAVWDNGEE